DQAYHRMDEFSPPPVPEQVLTALEIQGAAVFNDTMFSCSGCHRTGIQTVDEIANDGNNGLDAVRVDPGKNGRFRVASLRNIAVTGPYMHDGRFSTLREVIDHYDHGIQNSPDLSFKLKNGDEPRRMNFTEDEKAALEAFLHTLTDDAFLSDPRFSDPFE